MTGDAVRDRLAVLLATALERDPRDLAGVPDDTPLLGDGLGLDSATGMWLLAMVRDELGVDVAAEDLALDSLETIGTLTAFVASRTRP